MSKGKHMFLELWIGRLDPKLGNRDQNYHFQLLL